MANRTPKSLRSTLPLSLVNAVGDPLSDTLLPLNADNAMKLAQRVAGLDDFGDDSGGFRKRLEETLESTGQIGLNTVGRFGVSYSIHWHLTNRLRMVELLKQRPDIADIHIERPIVITGLFRTGTTFLHNVLVAS